MADAYLGCLVNLSVLKIRNRLGTSANGRVAESFHGHCSSLTYILVIPKPAVTTSASLKLLTQALWRNMMCWYGAWHAAADMRETLLQHQHPLLPRITLGSIEVRETILLLPLFFSPHHQVCKGEDTRYKLLINCASFNKFKHAW